MNKFLSFLLCLFIQTNLFAEGFVVGTHVLTSDGYALIESLKRGDQVISLGKNGALSTNTIAHVYQEKTSCLFEITVDGEKMYVAPEHQFFSPSQKIWTHAQNLKSFDDLWNPQEVVSIDEIKQINFQEEVIVYVLTVKPDHTFFVTRKNILVHNWSFTIPIFKYVFGEGLKFVAAKVLAALFGYQLLKEGVKHLAKQKGGDVYGFDTAEMPPMFDPEDPDEEDQQYWRIDAKLEHRDDFPTHPSTPVGRRGSAPECKVKDGTNRPQVINGREYSGHSLDSMQERGLTPRVIENTIKQGIKTSGNKPNTSKYYDVDNNVTVITNSRTGRVVTAFCGK